MCEKLAYYSFRMSYRHYLPFQDLCAVVSTKKKVTVLCLLDFLHG